MKLRSYSDLLLYLKSNPLEVCWYGSRASDVCGLEKLISIKGIISCYGSSDIPKNIPTLTNETFGIRPKISIDDLAGKLIKDGTLLKFVKENNIKAILPYDSNLDLEIFCKQNGIVYYSSPDKLKDELRDKTKIDEISKAIGLPIIPGIPGTIDEFDYESLVKKFGLPLFLHFAEGAGGTGNRIVNSFEEFEKVKAEKKGRRLNVKKYFVGKSCCTDVCVTPKSVLCGSLEEMIIGSQPINSNPTEYVASSWFQNNYSYEFRKRIHEICIDLGNYLRKRGFLGAFHPDFLFGDNGEIFLTELNMRFGGSCGVVNRIEMEVGRIPYMLQNVISFLGNDIEFDAGEINEQSLQSLNYSLLILKNYFGKPVRINNAYKSGIYRLVGDRIESTGKTRFGDLNNEDLIFISGLPDSKEDAVIEENAFICEVITTSPNSDSRSKLNKFGKNLANRIFEQIVR